VKYLNNIVEQDHRNVNRLTSPGLGFGNFFLDGETNAGRLRGDGNDKEKGRFGTSVVVTSRPRRSSSPRCSKLPFEK
jgi:hypothetical protein